MECVRQKKGNVQVEIWGTGSPMREFLWSEEMADACVFVMENIDFEDLKPKNTKEIRNCHINIGTEKRNQYWRCCPFDKKNCRI